MTRMEAIKGALQQISLEEKNLAATQKKHDAMRDAEYITQLEQTYKNQEAE